MCDCGEDLGLYSVITTTPSVSQSCLLNNTHPFLFFNDLLDSIINPRFLLKPLYETTSGASLCLINSFLEIFNTMKLYCFQGIVEYIEILLKNIYYCKEESKLTLFQLRFLMICNQSPTRLQWHPTISLITLQLVRAVPHLQYHRPQGALTSQGRINPNRLQQLPGPWLFLKLSLRSGRRISTDNICKNTDTTDITSTELRCDRDTSPPH